MGVDWGGRVLCRILEVAKPMTAIDTEWVTHPWVDPGVRAIRFGIYGVPGPDWGRTVEVAQAAESFGFDGFWAADHPTQHMHDGWTTLAGLAEHTTTIRLGSLATCLHYRSPCLLARIVADVDRHSAGRVLLGVGIGDSEREFAQLGLPLPDLRTRQAALEDALQIVNGVWGESPLTYEGKYFRVTEARVSPGPIQLPRVPILIAGGGERVTLRQVAQFADAANFGPGTAMGNAWTPDDIRRKYAVLRQHCDRIGRPFDSVLRTHTSLIATLSDHVGPKQGRLRTAIGEYDLFEGTPGEAIAHFQTLVEAGVQYFIVALFGDVIAKLNLLASEVIPALRAP
jgi:alkanesulfonate monooxygenase SsuD/methylene tetrahydromethanopterin reductase-like flavin-dependent oxidoreductase (luciferase family)